MHSYDYKLFDIGGGSGGVRAARVAAGLSTHVAIAESFRYGGICVIRGCVQKKLLAMPHTLPKILLVRRGSAGPCSLSASHGPC